MGDLVVSDIGSPIDAVADPISQAKMVRRVRDILGEDVRWLTVALAGDADDTGIGVTDGTDWNEGSIIEWQNDGDQAYVQSVSGNSCTVIRSVNGTEGAEHAAGATSIATKDPIYPFIKVVDAIDATIATSWPWIWGVTTTEFSSTVVANNQYVNQPYALDEGATIDLISVAQGSGNTLGPEVLFYGPGGDGKPCTFYGPQALLASDLLTTDTRAHVSFPRGHYNTTYTLTIRGRKRLTNATVVGEYSDFDEGNVSETLCWGAAARLMKSQSAVRLRNDSRQWNNSVSIEDVNQTADFYYMEYRRLLMDTHDELMRTAPPMRKWSR